jgi:hypothetical protein
MSHGIRGSQLANMLLRMFQAFSATPEGRAACAGEPCTCTVPPKVAAKPDVPAPPSTVEAFKPAPAAPSKLDHYLRPIPIKETK